MARPLHPEFKFLAVTAVLVVLLGVQTFFSLVEKPEAEVFRPVALETTASRNPASVVTSVASLQQTVGASQVFEWDCGQTTQSIAVTGSQLRIKGGKCQNVEVKNSTNGFTASVFQTSKEEFTTDFIDLAEGDNKIQIISLQADGTKTSYELLVFKQPEASLNSSN